METRISKVNISAAGGTAAKGSKTCKVTLPNAWMERLGITPEDRDVELSFDGQAITLRKKPSPRDFAVSKEMLGHTVSRISFHDGEKLCSMIYADFSDRTLAVENFSGDIVKTAFGANLYPNWSDFQAFLAERCISKHRDGLQNYLQELRLDEYDPLEIIKKTEGRMAEDHQWLRIEEEI